MSWPGSSCWYSSKSGLSSRTDSEPKGPEWVVAVLCLLFCVATSAPTKIYTTYLPTLISWYYAGVRWRVRGALPPTNRSDLVETRKILVEYFCIIGAGKTRVV
jgi:hypothetical protein